MIPPRLFLQGNTGSSTVSALVTDPEGLQDIVGGRLVDPVSGGIYGVFATTSSPGAYTFSIDWLIMQAVRPVDSSPLGGSDRLVRAEFFDLHGHVGSADVAIRVDCGLSGYGVCNNQCVLMSSSMANCGACGRAVPPGQVCSAGQVQCPSARDTYCAAQQTCADLLSSPSHCGACGQGVRPGQVCRNGQSVCANAGETYCATAGVCADLEASSSHCGACGQPVQPGQVCRNGQSVCANSTDVYCPAQQVCANLQTSTSHCGACGNQVSVPLTCRNGAASCATPGQSPCLSGGQTVCVDLQTNANHCGQCGRSVTGTPQQCVAGTPTCATAGTNYCASTNTCVDLQTSSTHCGSCGNALGGTASCVAGQATCTRSTICSAGGVVSGCLNDSANCGGCRRRCPAYPSSAYDLYNQCSSPTTAQCSSTVYQSGNQLTGSSCNTLCAAATGYSGSCTSARARYSGATSSTMNFTCSQVPWWSSGGAALYSLSCECSVPANAAP